MSDAVISYQSLSKPRPVINPWLVAITVSMATFMEVLDTSIANVSLPHIAGNLGAGQDQSAWVLTSYLVSNAIILPISGWLASVMGRKRFYMSCVALFTLASLLCGLAPSLTWLLVFRVLQGIGGGGLAPSEQSILADTFEPRQRGMAFAIYGVAVVFALAVGPTLGGWITDNYNWRWIFFINIPVGILSLMMSYRLVHDSANAIKEKAEVWRNGLHVDYIGFGLVAIGLGSLQIVLDKGQEDDWLGSRFIQIFALAAAVGIIGAIVWELWVSPHPIVDLPLLKNRSLLSVIILMFIMGVILNSTTVLIPQFVQSMLGYTAEQAGLILMPGGFALMAVFPIAGALSGRVQPKYLMGAGLLITAMAMWHLTSFNTNVSFHELAMARLYQAIGLPLFFVPLNTIAYGDLPPGKSNSASALLNLMRNLGGSMGISLAFTMLDRRTLAHQSNLAAHVSQYNPASVHQMHLLQSLTGSAQAALSMIANEVTRQATMLAYIDVFQIMAVGCIVVLLLIMLLRHVDMDEKPVAGH